MNEIREVNSFSRNKNSEFEKFSLINFSSRLLNQIIFIIFLIVILILVGVFKKNVEISEWWTQSFSRGYLAFISFFTRYCPFSLTELFFISLLVIFVLTIILIIKNLINKNWMTSINKFLSMAIVVLSTITMYNLSCEFSYNRKPVELPYYTSQVDNDEFIDIYNYYASDLNYCISQLQFKENGDVKRNQTVFSISKKVNDAYHILDSNPYFLQTYTYTKPMATSLIYRELQITGMTFNCFGEANINNLATNVELPVTIAHEMAHTKCVMREDEANQTAFYVCLNSEDPYLRFSAYALYFYQVGNMTAERYIGKGHQNELVTVSTNYVTAKNYAYQYWKKHDLLGKIGDWFNNLYIKSSGVEEGTESYSGGTASEDIPDEHEPEKVQLIPSKYQQLFFEKYYRMKG